MVSDYAPSRGRVSDPTAAPPGSELAQRLKARDDARAALDQATEQRDAARTAHAQALAALDDVTDQTTAQQGAQLVGARVLAQTRRDRAEAAHQAAAAAFDDAETRLATAWRAYLAGAYAADRALGQGQPVPADVAARLQQLAGDDSSRRRQELGR